MKSLAKRVCFSERSVMAVEAYKAKVASLTEDAVKYKSDLKHTSTAK